MKYAGPWPGPVLASAGLWGLNRRWEIFVSLCFSKTQFVNYPFNVSKADLGYMLHACCLGPWPATRDPGQLHGS